MAHLLMMENNCTKSYQNPSVDVGYMLWTRQGRKKCGRMPDGQQFSREGWIDGQQ